MNGLQIFNNEQFGNVRIAADENGKPLFCGSDVAKALGYERPNDAISAHCRYTVKRSIPHPQSPSKTMEMSLIPEGLGERKVAPTVAQNKKGVNMQELIKVDYSDSNRPTVLGRDLHEMLGVETPYRLWFPRMCEYGFSDGVDYTPYNFVHPQNHQEITDHQLTIPMAKELCMLQRTERGKECRQYFIQIEEEWNKPELLMARALHAADEQIKRLTAKVKSDAPKVLFADAVEASHTSILVGELAKLIRQNGVDIGQNRLFKWMRENGFIMRNQNIPTQRSMDMGLMEIKERTINNPDGTVRITRTIMVTGKGQTYFVNRLLAA